MKERSGLFEANALIRFFFHTDPDELDDPQWEAQLLMALFLENRFLGNISKLLGG